MVLGTKILAIDEKERWENLEEILINFTTHFLNPGDFNIGVINSFKPAYIILPKRQIDRRTLNALKTRVQKNGPFVIDLDEEKTAQNAKKSIEAHIIKAVMQNPEPNQKIANALHYLAENEIGISKGVFERMNLSREPSPWIFHYSESGAFLPVDTERPYPEAICIKPYNNKSKALIVLDTYRYYENDPHFPIPFPYRTLGKYKVVQLKKGALFFSNTALGPTYYDLLPKINSWIRGSNKDKSDFAKIFKRQLFNTIDDDLAYWTANPLKDERRNIVWTGMDVIRYYTDNLKAVPEHFSKLTNVDFSELELKLWDYALSALNPNNKYTPEEFSLKVDEFTQVRIRDLTLENISLVTGKISTPLREIYDGIMQSLGNKKNGESIDREVKKLFEERSNFDLGIKKGLRGEDFYHAYYSPRTDLSEEEVEKHFYRTLVKELIFLLELEKIKGNGKTIDRLKVYGRDIDSGNLNKRLRPLARLTGYTPKEEIEKEYRDRREIELSQYKNHFLWMEFYKKARKCDLTLNVFTRNSPLAQCVEEIKYFVGVISNPLRKIRGDIEKLIQNDERIRVLYQKSTGNNSTPIDYQGLFKSLEGTIKSTKNEVERDSLMLLLQFSKINYLVTITNRLKNFDKIYREKLVKND